MNKKRMKKIILTFVSLLMGGLCSVLVACSDEEHTVPVFPESSVYGTIFQALYSQVSGAAEGIR